MLQRSARFRLLLLALAFCGFHGAAEAQVKLTITNNGPNSGAVGVQPGGNVCNPNPGGGGGGAPCEFFYPAGTPLRLMANSPSTPGIFNNGSGDAEQCGIDGTSVCEFTLNGDSSITATFDAGAGPFPSMTINLLSHGGGKGNVGADNNQCQNFELGFSACTTYYGAGSSVRLQGRSMPGNIFAGFSGGTVDAGGCAGTGNCNFTLSNNSTVDATFAAMSAVAIEPPLSRTINQGNSTFFNARATFTNGMTRLSFNGQSPWMNHVPMDVARFSLAAAVVSDRYYAIGGVDGTCAGGPCAFAPRARVEVFNPEITLIAQFDQAWTSRASMTIPREGLAAAAVDGRIYVFGGHTTGGVTVASIESYDPSANAWSSALLPMPGGPRAGMAAAAIDNIIYVVGGSPSVGGDPLAPVATVEAYNTSTGNWTTTSMSVARFRPGAAAVNGILYVMGGDGSGTVEAYDGTTWTTKTSMPDGGGMHSAVALNGLIYAIGGPSATMKVYNPALDSWATLNSLPSPLNQFGLAVLDGRLFAAGGLSGGSTAVNTFTANRPPEATWWSSNSTVARINSGNSGSVQGMSVGTATISARLVTIDSDPDGTVTVTSGGGGGGGGSNITLGIPQDPAANPPNPPSPALLTQVGNTENWGCGTFGQNSTGPWTVEIDYGDGGGFQIVPFELNPTPGTGCTGTGSNAKGMFFFNHAYSEADTYQVRVRVTNTTTPSQTTTGSFHVEVQEGGGGGGGGNNCVPIVSNISVIGTVPFDRVHVAVFDRVTGQLLTDDETALPLGPFSGASLPAGQYRFEFSVPAGYMVTPSSFIIDAVCDVPIDINLTVQAIPPAISLSLSPNVLWPPNNKMVPITATIEASSFDGHPTTVVLESITNNESGAGDVAEATFGTDDRNFEVRAKRNGGGSGRTYTVTYRATDTVTGASTLISGTIFVPHDQGQ